MNPQPSTFAGDPCHNISIVSLVNNCSLDAKSMNGLCWRPDQASTDRCGASWQLRAPASPAPTLTLPFPLLTFTHQSHPSKRHFHPSFLQSSSQLVFTFASSSTTARSITAHAPTLRQATRYCQPARLRVLNINSIERHLLALCQPQTLRRLPSTSIHASCRNTVASFLRL